MNVAPAKTPTTSKPKLLDQVRLKLRNRHYSRRTEETYLQWIRRFILFHKKRHPREMGEKEINAYLSHLAVRRRVAASTQNQALSAILFLYKHVLRQEIGDLGEIDWSRKPKRLPEVLTRQEVRSVLAQLEGTPRQMAMLLYGAGLRLLECARLRVKDVDFAADQILIRAAKGDKDRITLLPAAAKADLDQDLKFVQRQHEQDVKGGAGWVELPAALGRKYPKAGQEWSWQWVFPATRMYTDPRTGQRRRHHLHETVVQRAVKQAVRAAGLSKRASCHTFRHSFATHGSTTLTASLFEDGYDIRTAQELLGHKDVKTTMMYSHVLNRGYAGVRGPADRLWEQRRTGSREGI